MRGNTRQGSDCRGGADEEGETSKRSPENGYRHCGAIDISVEDLRKADRKNYAVVAVESTARDTSTSACQPHFPSDIYTQNASSTGLF